MYSRIWILNYQYIDGYVMFNIFKSKKKMNCNNVYKPIIKIHTNDYQTTTKARI